MPSALQVFMIQERTDQWIFITLHLTKFLEGFIYQAFEATKLSY